MLRIHYFNLNTIHTLFHLQELKFPRDVVDKGYSALSALELLVARELLTHQSSNLFDQHSPG